MQSNTESENGIIFRIKKYAIHDGPGIRTTVFLKGCPLNCWWCHNPEGRDPKPEIMEYTHSPEKQRVVGKVVTVSEITAEIEKDVIFYDESDGGVTFSGGEPLMQAVFLEALLNRCREREIHTALDTTGYASEEIFNRVCQCADLILFDLKIMDDALHRKYSGVSNKNILENLKRIAGNGKAVRIRFPVIPKITDSPDNIKQMTEFLKELYLITHIDILPFHNIAEGKYHKLDIENRMRGIEPPSDFHVQELQKHFESHGFISKVGG